MKTFKTQWYLLLIVPFLILTSCDDDDKKTGLQGTWLLTSTVISGCVDSDLNKTITCTTSCTEITFTKNQLISDVGVTEFVFSYRTVGNKLFTSNPSDPDVEVEHSFTLTKDTFVLTGPGVRGEGCIEVSTYIRK